MIPSMANATVGQTPVDERADLIAIARSYLGDRASRVTPTRSARPNYPTTTSQRTAFSTTVDRLGGVRRGLNDLHGGYAGIVVIIPIMVTTLLLSTPTGAAAAPAAATKSTDQGTRDPASIPFSSHEYSSPVARLSAEGPLFEGLAEGDRRGWLGGHGYQAAGVVVRQRDSPGTRLSPRPRGPGAQYVSPGQCSAVATRATPTGQVMPFGPWLQYPPGFLSRYCWW